MMSQSRIAYLISQYPAASHTFIRREVTSLRAHGIDIETFSIRSPSPSECTSDADRSEADRTWYVLSLGAVSILAANFFEGVCHPIRYLNTLRLAQRHRAPGLKSALWSLFHFSESMVLARELRNRGISHLHNHFANSGATVGLLASSYLEIPWSLTLHGISETDYPAGLTLPAKIEAATFVACVSWFGRAQAMRITQPRQWAKMEIVRCGVDTDDPTLKPLLEKTHRERQRIICVARLSPEKGLLGLVSVVAELNAGGVPCDLTLVGDGPERPVLDDHIRVLGIGENITFLGRLDERATLAAVADADLLVLPSFMEGLPVVLMEAMSLGIPVIASRVAGVPELVEDGVTGLLFRPADWRDLESKIRRILVDDDQSSDMIVQARKTVEREFDIKRTVLPLIDHFSSCAPDPR